MARHHRRQCNTFCVTVTVGAVASVICFHMTFLICLLEPLSEDHFDMDTFKDDNDDKWKDV